MATAELRIGMKVRDRVTKKIGTITGKAEYLYGTPAFLFEYVDKTGALFANWYESERFENVQGK